MPPVPRATARPHASLRSVGATRVAVHEYPPLPSPPLGRLTATASEPYVSACARVCWTRAARGCALSPLAPALVFSPSSPRLSVYVVFVCKKTVLPKKGLQVLISVPLALPYPGDLEAVVIAELGD